MQQQQASSSSSSSAPNPFLNSPQTPPDASSSGMFSPSQQNVAKSLFPPSPSDTVKITTRTPDTPSTLPSKNSKIGQLRDFVAAQGLNVDTSIRYAKGGDPGRSKDDVYADLVREYQKLTTLGYS